jgi:hypothetical protein
MAATRTSAVLNRFDAPVRLRELFPVGDQLGQNPVLIGDLDDIGGSTFAA